MHQRKVYHGHLIDNQHIRLQGILPVPHKAIYIALFLRIPADLQEAVDRLCLISGGLRHSFSRPSCRRRQQNAHPLALKKLDHGINGSRLTGPGPAGQDQKPVLDGFYHRLVLHGV